MRGQGDGRHVANIFIFFRQPVFGFLERVNRIFPQRRIGAGDELRQLDQNGNDNIINHNVEDVGLAEVEVEINQHVEPEEPLPGGSRRRPREEDDDDDESSRKRFRWWDEITDSDCESCSDDSDVSSIGYESDEDDLVAEDEAEDLLSGATRERKSNEQDDVDDIVTEERDSYPGVSRKRQSNEQDDVDGIVTEERDSYPGVSRKRERDEEDEDERSAKKSRW